MTVTFDQHDPAKGGRKGRGSVAGLDYSPLPRLTWHSISMGVLISMGGLM